MIRLVSSSLLVKCLTRQGGRPRSKAAIYYRALSGLRNGYASTAAYSWTSTNEVQILPGWRSLPWKAEMDAVGSCLTRDAAERGALQALGTHKRGTSSRNRLCLRLCAQCWTTSTLGVSVSSDKGLCRHCWRTQKRSVGREWAEN